MKWPEPAVDPSSGQASMSRICFGLLILTVIGLVGAAVFIKAPIKEPANLLVAALGITAGVYAGNSVAGAWGRSKAPAPEKTETLEPPGKSDGPVG